MIAQFWFAESAPEDHIVLELAWQDGMAQARVHSPDEVVATLTLWDIPTKNEDEPMKLGIALGYAVMIATMSQTPLTLSGDFSAWPDAWGPLSTRSVISFDRARAH